MLNAQMCYCHAIVNTGYLHRSLLATTKWLAASQRLALHWQHRMGSFTGCQGQHNNHTKNTVYPAIHCSNVIACFVFFSEVRFVNSPEIGPLFYSITVIILGSGV